MKIIKEGEYPSNNKIICNGCNCVFQYYDSEIQTRATTLDEIEFFGGLVYTYKYVKCPCCGESCFVTLYGKLKES